MDGLIHRSSSAPSTPTGSPIKDTSKTSCQIDEFTNKHRKVQFPSDEQIVTNYFEAPDPWSLAPQQLTSQNLVEAYISSCDQQGIKPLPRLVNQIKRFNTFDVRDQDLNLKGEKLDSKQCEALEEVFKRVRFRSVHLESCDLDEEGASALFDIIEYYESATHLNISHNKNIDTRGWQACCRMLTKTSCLQHLDLKGCVLSEQILLVLGRALRCGSHLISLNVENSGIRGRSLAILVAALKMNSSLRFLYLGDNKLCPVDAGQIANLLRANSTLEYLDLRNNDLKDDGLHDIAEGIKEQPAGPGEGLKYLILTNNGITFDGIQSLIQAMPFARALKTLSLNHNEIGDNGVIELKEGIEASQNLVHLSLRKCNISCQGAIALSKCLIENESLARIDLRENQISEEGLSALAKSMKANKSIIRLDISNNASAVNCEYENIQRHLDEINEYCQRNQRIEDNMFDTQTLESPNIITHNLFSFPNSFTNGSIKTRRLSTDDGDKEERCDEVKNVKCEEKKISMCTASTRKPILRSSSFGSWEAKSSEREVRRSGRFSVSPLPDPESPPAFTSLTDTKKGTYSVKDMNDSSNHQNMNKSESSSFSENGLFSDLSNSTQTTSEELSTTTTTDLDTSNDTSFSFPSSSSTSSSHCEKTRKKITFLLPEMNEFSEPSHFKGQNHNRRMSTPVVSTLSLPQVRPKIPSLKMRKALDGLDLKSSVPISPTRLCQDWDFSDPVSLKLPPEVEEIMGRCGIAN